MFNPEPKRCASCRTPYWNKPYERHVQGERQLAARQKFGPDEKAKFARDLLNWDAAKGIYQLPPSPAVGEKQKRPALREDRGMRRRRPLLGHRARVRRKRGVSAQKCRRK